MVASDILCSSDIGALRAELDSDWLPDPWSWADVAGLEASDDEPVELLETPLVAGRTRLVPYLRPGTRLALNRTTASVVGLDALLREGVFGYRPGKGGVIRHYRSEYRRRRDYEQLLAERHPWVARADLRQFFPSMTLPWLEEVIRSGSAQLGVPTPDLSVLRRLAGEVGYPLPEGYSASRALANYGLVPVDDRADRDFTRWIDDYSLFAESKQAAEARTRELELALVGTPFELAPEKTVVQPSDVAILERPVGSLDDLHCDVLDVTDSLLQLRDAPTDSRYERDLRHLLRLAAERRDQSALTEIRWSIDRDRIPPACMPRLAWYLSSVAGHSDAEQLLPAVIERNPTDFALIRLAPAAWSFDSGVVRGCREWLLRGAEHGWMTWLATLRTVARHLPNDLAGMAPPDDLPWTLRAWRLALEEARGQALDAPPMATFL